MLRILSINAAEWSIPTLIMYLTVLAIARFGLSIRLSVVKVISLFFVSLFITTGYDAIFEIQNKGLRLNDAMPQFGGIPNIFTVPFMSSAAALLLGHKFWRRPET